MSYLSVLYRRGFLFSIFFLAVIASTSSLALGAGLTLTWQDNSTNEDGFKIERGVSGSYAQIASVGPNIQSYTDMGLLAGTTYCYRVRAFNSSGVSSPSNESCATIPVTTFALALTKSGAGNGSVTSNPAGITCGSDCSEIYSSGTVVSLIATPASGSTFAGWSGDSDCSDGIVTMSVNKSCTATFSLNPAGYVLTVNIASGLSSGGSGSGTITSSPLGITCGGDCSEAYSSGTIVSLAATPAAGSTFAGWSGDSDCSDGLVTMNASKSCIATFKLETPTLTVVRSGNGTVTSSPSGIDCGTACSMSYAKGTKVTLSAKASSDSRFAGWAGGGCQGVGDCTISVENQTTVSATFLGAIHAALGIFRPSTGEWFFDANGNGKWEGCNVDLCLGPFGADGDLPVVGDWTGIGSNIGVLRPSSSEWLWLLDLNGNGKIDDCNIDACLHSVKTSLPVVGDWTGSGVEMLGAVISGRTPKWYLDRRGNGIEGDCNSDVCLTFPIAQGDFPVSGDWNGTGKAKIGTFRPATGEWLLDLSGNGQWKNCKFDKCVKSFGTPGDRPVIGDWNGTGTAQIGLYRPATGEWFLDVNGNGKWDGCGVDACVQFLGKHEGDLPVVGRNSPRVYAANP
jgi:Divergent InlB B-repeat domain